MPFLGGKVVKPLATDLSAWQLLQLGWAYFRPSSGNALHCRLGGEPQTIGGQSVIVGSEDNAATIAMFIGRSAPLPPPQGLPYAPGCTVGKHRVGVGRVRSVLGGRRPAAAVAAGHFFSPPELLPSPPDDSLPDDSLRDSLADDPSPAPSLAGRPEPVRSRSSRSPCP